jgi:hypothetical protein
MRVLAILAVTVCLLSGTSDASPRATRNGQPALLSAFDDHRIVALMSPVVGNYVFDLIADRGRTADSPMRPAAVLQRAVESGVLLYE